MTRANLAFNPSFRNGTTGYTALNGANLAVKTGFAFYGNEALQVTKSTRNGSGVQSSSVAVTPGLKYAYSAYVAVPPIAPRQESAGLVLTVTWLTSAGVIVSTDSTPIVTVNAGGGWDRLTGVSDAPEGSSWASISISQLVAGSARQTFFVDAILFEQAAFVGGYLDNVTQALHGHLQDAGLSPLPLPTVGGLQLRADVTLGDLVLNTIDENNVTWVCTDIDGWWGHAEADLPSIDRGVADGDYDVSGRTKARTFTLEGSFLLDDPSKLTSTRDRLVAATNLIRKGAWLRTNEEPTRAAFVRLSGKPKIETVNARGRTDFSIGLKAADPIRYEWNDRDPEGLTTVNVEVPPVETNYMQNPSMEFGDAPYTYETNYVQNPSAVGTSLAYSSTSRVADTTGTRGFAYKTTTNNTSFFESTLVAAQRGPTVPGQQWWVGGTFHLDPSVIGARAIDLQCRFRDSSGNILNPLPLGNTIPYGEYYAWLGTPDNSPSAKYTPDGTVFNVVPNPRAEGATSGLVGYSAPTPTMVADTSTGSGSKSYKVAASNSGYSGVRVTSDIPAGSAKKWFVRARVRQDTGVYGARRYLANLGFQTASGTSINAVDGARVTLTPRGTFHRWLGDANNSVTERYNGNGRVYNYIQNPAPATSGTSSFQNQTGMPVVLGTDGVVAPETGTQAYIANTTTVGVAAINLTAANRPTVSPGQNQRWWASLKARMTGGYGARTISTYLRFYDSSGGDVGTTMQDVTITPAGVFRRWSGTPDASVSEEYSGTDKRLNMIPNPAARTALDGSPSLGKGSSTAVLATVTSQAFLGGSAFSITPNSTNIDTFMGFGDTGAIQLGLTAGSTYTVSGSIYLPAPLTGTINSNALKIAAYTRVGTGSYVTTTSSAAPNAAGETRLSVTFTVPTGTSEAFVRFYNGSANDTSNGLPNVVYWSKLRLDVSSKSPDYFDGSTVTPIAGKYRSWAGTVSNSASMEVAADNSFRTNRIANPNFSSGITNWNGPNGAWDSTNFRFNGTATVAIANGNGLAITTSSAIPGETRRFGVLFYNTGTSAIPVSLQLQYRNSSAAVIQYNDGVQATVQPGTQLWLTNSTGTSGYPAGTASVGVALRTGAAGVPVGATWAVDNAIDTEYGDGTALKSSDYFDGGSTDSTLVLPSGTPSDIVSYAVTGVAPSNAATVGVVFVRKNLGDGGVALAPVGDTFSVASVSLVQNSTTTAPAYFDANTVLPTTGLSHRWIGTANASPSIETDVTGAQRLNLAVDPEAVNSSIAVGTVGWSKSRWFGGNVTPGTYTTVTNAGDTPFPDVTTYLRKTWTTAAPTTSTGNTGFGNSNGTTGAMPVVPGQTYTVSSYLRASTYHGTSSMKIQWISADGRILTTSYGVNIALPAGEWTRISLTDTVPVGAYFMALISDVDGTEGWPVNSTLDGTALLVEQTNTLKTFFSGDSNTPASGTLHGWNGAANNASSYEYYPDGTQRTNRAPNPSFESGIASIGSGPAFSLSSDTAQTLYGGKSLKITRVSGVQVSDAYAFYTLSMIPGRTYTVSFYTYGGSGVYSLGVNGQRQQWTGQNYWQRVSMTVTPGDTTMYIAEPAGGTPTVGSLWIDGLLVEETTTLGDYFDGSTVDPNLVASDIPTGNVPTVFELTAVATTPPSAAKVVATITRSPEVLPSTSDVFYLDNIMVTAQDTDATPAYFDGSFADTYVPGVATMNFVPSGIFHKWTGTSGNSTSIEVDGTNTRTNYVVSPRPNASLTNYGTRNSTNVTTSLTYVASGAPDGGSFVRNTLTANNGSWWRTVTNSLTIPAGTVTQAVWLRSSFTGAILINFRYTSGSTGEVGTAITLQANQWTRVNLSTSRDVATQVVLEVGGTAASAVSVGDYLDASMWLMEAGTTVGDYFDGDTTSQGSGNASDIYTVSATAIAPNVPNATAELAAIRRPDYSVATNDTFYMTDTYLVSSENDPGFYDGNTPTDANDFSYGWAVSPNNSASLKLVTPVLYADGINARLSQSNAWALSGTSSLRIDPDVNANRNAAADLIPMVYGSLTLGNTYTLSLTAYREHASAEPSEMAYRAYVGDTEISESKVIIPAGQGTYPLSITFTVPSTASSQRLAVYNFEPYGGESLWIDNVILSDGSDIIEYFDGDSIDSDSEIFYWNGNPPRSTSVKTPGPVTVGTLKNIGTATVTGQVTLSGPLGAGSYVYNAATDEYITISSELRGVGGAAPIIETQLTNNIATITTGVPHNLEVGDKIVIAGAGRPYDSENGSWTVTAVNDLYPYTFNFVREWIDLDDVSSGGQVNLAKEDTLTLDTYQRSVTFNGSVEGNRSRVATLVDWMQFAPGDNVISFVDNASKRTVIRKASSGTTASITTADAHFLQPGDQIYVDLPEDAVLARKSLTSNVVTMTTTADHGFAVGDKVDITSTENSIIDWKSRASNVATVHTTVLGSFNVNDSIVVSLPTSATITTKSLTSNVATLTTSKPHGFSVGDSVSTTFPSSATVATKSVASGQASLGTTSAHGFAVGDTINVSLPTSVTVNNKFIQGTNVVLTATTSHGYSVGDVINVNLPTGAVLTNTRNMAGTSSYLATLNTTGNHGFIVGDLVSVSTNIPDNWMVGARAATASSLSITTTAAHNVTVGEVIKVSGVSDQHDGTWTVTAISGNTLTYGNFNQSSVYTVEASIATGGTVVDASIREGYNGVHVIEAVPSATSFSFLYYGQQRNSTNSKAASPSGTVANTTNTSIVGLFRLSGTPSATQFSYQTTDTVNLGGTTNNSNPT